MGLWEKLKGMVTDQSAQRDLSLALEFIKAKFEDLQRFLEQHPELLDKRFDPLFIRLATTQEDIGLRNWIDDRRMLLVRARIVGIEQAVSAHQDETHSVSQAMHEFIRCDDFEESRNIVARNSGLLSLSSQDVLFALAKQSESEKQQLFYEERRALLARCREIGVNEAYAEAAGKTISFNETVTLEATLTELMSGRWDARNRRALQAFPVLLEKKMDDVLCEESMSIDDERARHRHGIFRARLAFCRIGLMDEAFDEHWRPSILPILNAFDDSSRLYSSLQKLNKENVLVGLIKENPRLLAMIEAMRTQDTWMDLPAACSTPQGYEAEYAAIDVLKDGKPFARNQALIRLCENVLQKLEGEDASHFRAYVQYVLGTAYAQGEVESVLKAARCYAEASKFYTKDKPLDHVAVLMAYASAFKQLDFSDKVDNFRTAIAQLEDALTLCSPEKSPSWYGQIHAALGDAHSRRTRKMKGSDYNKAIEHYKEAIRIFEPGNGLNLLLLESAYVDTLKQLGRCYLAQERWEEVLEISEQAIIIGEEKYDRDFSNVRKERHTSAAAIFYRHAAYAHARLGRIEEAWRYLERGRTRVLGQALELRPARPAGVPDGTWETFETASKALRDFKWMDFMIFDAEHDDPIKSMEPARKQSEKLEAEFATAKEQVNKFAFLPRKEKDVRDVRDSLPDPHTALVTFCITEQGSLAFICTKESEVQIVHIPDFKDDALQRLLWNSDRLGRPLGGWLLDHLLSRESAANEEDTEIWRATIKSTLETLGRELLAPIFSALPADIKNIIFIPSGTLALLPLHAAPLSPTDTELWCDRYQISYVPSIKLLVNCQKKTSRKVTESIYAVINPEEDPSLIFTHIEGAALSDIFAESEVCEGAEGTTDAFIRGASGRSYVHFACHGRHEFDSNKSGIVLANNILTVDELFEGRLSLSDLRVVTLSACESGMIEVTTNNADEYVGLPAGFMLAGVPCIVSSLWTIPDISSAILMEQFYRNHIKKGLTLVKALEDAQKFVRGMKLEEVLNYISKYYLSYDDDKKAELLKYKQHYQFLMSQSPEQQPFAHPYYWAAFVINGM